jgi:hypothetical protein
MPRGAPSRPMEETRISPARSLRRSATGSASASRSSSGSMHVRLQFAAFATATLNRQGPIRRVARDPPPNLGKRGRVRSARRAVLVAIDPFADSSHCPGLSVRQRAVRGRGRCRLLPRPARMSPARTRWAWWRVAAAIWVGWSPSRAAWVATRSPRFSRRSGPHAARPTKPKISVAPRRQMRARKLRRMGRRHRGYARLEDDHGVLRPTPRAEATFRTPPDRRHLR